MKIQIFYDYFLTGVGPGQAPKLREIYGYGKRVAAHTEYSRMLSEHGMLGLFSLLLLFGISLFHFFRSQPIEKKLIQNIFGIFYIISFNFAKLLKIIL